MAENIGDANISINIALQELRNQLLQAQVEVEKSISQMKKDIELNVKTNIDGQLKSQIDGVSQSFKSVETEVQNFSNTGTAALDEVSDSINNTAAEATAFQEVITLLGGSMVSAGVVVGVVLVALVELGVAIYAVVKFTGDVIDQVKLYIGQNEDLSDAIDTVKGALKILYDGFVDIYNMLRDRVAHAVVDLIEGMVDSWKEMNRVSGAGDGLLGSLKNLMQSGLTAVIRVVDAVIKIFQSFSVTTDDTKSKVDGLTTIVNTFSGVMNAVAFVINSVSKGIEIFGNAASGVVSKLQPVINKISEILSGIAKIASSGLGYLFGVNSFSGGSSPSGSYGPEAGDKSFGTEEYGPGNQEGKNEFNLQSNKTTGSKGGGSNTKTEVEDLTKLKEKLSEIVDLRVRDLETLAKVVTKQFEYNEEVFKIAGREVDTSRKVLQESMDAEHKLKGLKIQNEGDVLKIALFNIDDKYRKEIQNINSSNIAEQTKIKLIKELETKKAAEIEKINMESGAKQIGFLQSGFNAVTQAIGTGFNNVWNSVFGEANSLFEILMKNIYDSLIELAASGVFKLIINLLSGGSAGFLSFLFADGGYTGDGNDDEPAGIVHRNEFVVSSAGTSIAGNRELLEAMNRGEDVASLVGSVERRYASAQSVRADAFRNINSGFGSGDRSININLGGVSATAHVQKLTGLNENDWIGIVDDELLPQISKALKRAGKEVLDNTIS